MSNSHHGDSTLQGTSDSKKVVASSQKDKVEACESESQRVQRKLGGRNFVFGALSGVFAGALLQPFDVVRTHLQGRMTSVSTVGSAAISSSTLPTAQNSFRSAGANMMGVVRDIVRKDGVSGLWRGTGPTCIRLGLGLGMYFASLEPILTGLAIAEQSWQSERVGAPATPAQPASAAARPYSTPQAAAVEDQTQHKSRVASYLPLGSRPHQLSPGLTFCAGVVARSMAAAVLCPVTVVKTRREVREGMEGPG